MNLFFIIVLNIFLWASPTFIFCTDTPILDILRNSDIEEGEQINQIRDLIKSGKGSIKETTQSGQSPLFYTENQKLIKFLLNQGMDINHVDNQGHNCLSHAIKRGYGLTLITTLINAKINLNQKDKKGDTPLHAAINSMERKETIEIIKLLLKKGANVNEKNNKGRTPLHAAVFESYLLPIRGIEIIQLLIQNGASINAKDENGTTPLHEAIGSQEEKLVELLIDKGADVNAKDNEGATPLSKALDANEAEIVEILMSKGSRNSKLITTDTLKKIVNMIIFLDEWSEKSRAQEKGTLGACGQAISAAIKQNIIIITSPSLIEALFIAAHKENKKAQATIKKLTDPKKWLICASALKDKNREFLVLIPRGRYKTASLQSLSLKKNLDIIANDVIEYELTTHSSGKYSIESLMNLFISNKKIHKNIYLFGHGGYIPRGQNIKKMFPNSRAFVGLSFEEYDTLLRFFDKIGCSFLMISSCYATGTNALKAHQHLLTALKKSSDTVYEPQFPIAISGIGDVVVYSKYNADFNEFFNKLSCFFYKRDSIPSHWIADPFKSIFSSIIDAEAQNACMIRFPHMRGYLQLIDAHKNLAIITYPMLLHYELGAKLKNQESRIKTDSQQAIIIYPQHVMIPLDLTKELPIFSGIPGNAFHIINTLKIDKPYSDTSLEEMFFSVQIKALSNKSFYIKKLHYRDKVFQNVFIVTHRKLRSAKYQDYDEEFSCYVPLLTKKKYSKISIKRDHDETDRQKDVRQTSIISENGFYREMRAWINESTPSDEALFQASGGIDTLVTVKKNIALIFNRLKTKKK